MTQFLKMKSIQFLKNLYLGGNMDFNCHILVGLTLKGGWIWLPFLIDILIIEIPASVFHYQIHIQIQTIAFCMWNEIFPEVYPLAYCTCGLAGNRVARLMWFYTIQNSPQARVFYLLMWGLLPKGQIHRVVHRSFHDCFKMA